MHIFTRFSMALAFAFILMTGCFRTSQAAERIYLSGHGKDDTVPWAFMCTSGAQSSYWTNLPVPSNWELFGFGTLNYYRDLTNAYTERGLYRHEFSIPKEWQGDHVFLVFDGVMTDCEAKLNGNPLDPIHQGAFYRFKYEVSQLAHIGGTNLLEVTVSKHSANTSVNKAERSADYWVFGGIFRPVYLERQPPEFIENLAVDAKADGSFFAKVIGDHVTDGTAVVAQIQNLDGSSVGKPFAAIMSNNVAVLNSRLRSPKNWTAETPNLYKLELALNRNGTSWSVTEKRFGFRTMEVREGDGFYLNGQRIVLKGVCRHSFWPESGRTLSEAVHRLDIETIKDANMNAVRMSHYPPDEQFLDLCDELGLYVLDELGGWHQCYDTNVGPNVLREMVTRDVNHPCILFWDNGNEGGWNTNLDNLFAEYDPQNRHVLHPWSPFRGVGTAHYLAYDKAALACQGIATYYSKGQEFANSNDPVRYIYMPTEFNHGLFDGGAGAGLQDYWSLMTSSKLLGGGFIWALLDEGVKRPDNGKIDVAGNQAPDGIVGPYRQREASFYAIKSVWSPITLVAGQSLPSRRIKIANHYGFINANQCEFTWELRRFASPVDTNAGYSVIKSGKARVPSIKPGAKGNLTLDLPKDWKNANALALVAKDPSGREVESWSWSLSQNYEFETTLNVAATKLTETPEGFEISNGTSSFLISKVTGMLLRVNCEAHAFSLTNGPRAALGDSKLIAIVGRRDGDKRVVEATFSGGLKQVTWTLEPKGWLQCDYTYSATGAVSFHGIAFDYPEASVKAKRWLGDGPYRVWKNRLEGVNLNVWTNDYNNTITGWSDWNYPEFKGCFANVQWMQLQTDEGEITFVPSKGTFVQVLNPEFPAKSIAGNTIAELPKAGLAFLQAIPPVGTKFKEAKFSGPGGKPNVATGDYSGTVRFLFKARRLP